MITSCTIQLTLKGSEEKERVVVLVMSEGYELLSPPGEGMSKL